MRENRIPPFKKHQIIARAARLTKTAHIRLVHRTSFDRMTQSPGYISIRSYAEFRCILSSAFRRVGDCEDSHFGITLFKSTGFLRDQLTIATLFEHRIALAL